ncbi:MAG: hypothetical protein JEZ06_16990 [Anaerolineaceae bacterium]|nr:hypothetical protein [Anaerolineaceae bacterium]
MRSNWMFGRFETISEIDHFLNNVLNPVAPREHFISELSRRLTFNPEIIFEKRKQAKAYIMVSLGLFSGILLFWLTRKGKKSPD